MLQSVPKQTQWVQRMTWNLTISDHNLNLFGPWWGLSGASARRAYTCLHVEHRLRHHVVRAATSSLGSPVYRLNLAYLYELKSHEWDTKEVDIVSIYLSKVYGYKSATLILLCNLKRRGNHPHLRLTPGDIFIDTSSVVGGCIWSRFTNIDIHYCKFELNQLLILKLYAMIECYICTPRIKLCTTWIFGWMLLL